MCLTRSLLIGFSLSSCLLSFSAHAKVFVPGEVERLKLECKKGHVRHCDALAQYYAEHEDPHKTSFLKLGCKTGSAESCRVLGFWTEMSSDPLQSNIPPQKRALEAFRRGCKLGDPKSCYSAGRIILDQTLTRHESDKQPPEASIRFFTKACEMNEAAGCAAMARLTKNPNERQRFKKRMCKLEPIRCQSIRQKEPSLKKLCEKGEGAACFRMAKQSKNDQDKLSFLKKGCETDHVDSCLGLVEFFKKHGEQDKSEKLMDLVCKSFQPPICLTRPGFKPNRK